MNARCIGGVLMLAAALMALAVRADPKDNPPRKVIVGTVCFRYKGTPEERAARLDRHLAEMAEKAKANHGGRRLDLAVFPESCLMRDGTNAMEKTVPMGFVLGTAGAAARRHGCYVAVGADLEEELEDGRVVPRNALVFLDRRGEVVGVYNKVHTALDWGDVNASVAESGMAAGSGFQVFDTDFGKVGGLICFDMSYPDGWAELKKGGAEIVVISTMSPQEFRPSLFAHMHQYWVVTSTPGHQAVVITPLGFNKERVADDAVLVTEIDLSYVMCHWSRQLRGGRSLAEKFGKDAFGGIYITGENNGIFWSNRADMPIGRMIEAVNVRPRDFEAARAERISAANRVPQRGRYR